MINVPVSKSKKGKGKLMSTVKTTTIGFESGKRRLRRYTTVILNVAILLGAILLVTWVLGKIVAVLHALVFSMALSGTPNPLPETFPLPENTFTKTEMPSMLQDAAVTSDHEVLYTVQRSGWR